jgi:hypothetical protein
MERYLRDVGGTAFYNILTQYSFGPHLRGTNPGAERFDRLVPGGPIRNSSTFGGAYFDRQSYPQVGTTSQPLTFESIERTVSDAMRRMRWSPGLNRIFFVFTAAHVQVCAPGNLACTFVTHGTTDSFCADHISYQRGQHPVIVGVMTDTWTLCGPRVAKIDHFSSQLSPNHDVEADLEIDALAHEQFEAVTDPLNGNSITRTATNGWYRSTPADGEIADLCQYQLGTVHSSDGTTVRLHGHPYRIQAMYSNVDHGCVFSYPRSGTR